MHAFIEIGHPAHVHFFKGVIEILRSKGHEVSLVTRNKEITDQLLKEMGYKFISISAPATSTAGLGFELMYRWWKIGRLLIRDRADVAISISGISTAFPAWLCKIPNISLTDTEDAILSNRIAFPFSTFVLTPKFFLNELGKNQIRYNGLHELAYLKEYSSAGLEDRLGLLNISKPYFLIRLIGYDALHDRDITRMDETELQQLIERLKRSGNVYISSQRELPVGLKQYQLQVPLSSIHDIMAGALAFFGESPTMAVESSLLGTPSFLISSRASRLGNMINLGKLDLLHNFNSFPQAAQRFRSITRLEDYKQQWRERALSFSNSCVDVTSFLASLIVKVAQEGKALNKSELKSIAGLLHDDQ